MIPGIFPSCYINVTVGLILDQMRVSQRQHFLIRLQIVFGDSFSVHVLARQQLPQTLRALKHSVLYSYITTGIDQYRRVAYHKRITLLTDAILRVDKPSLVHVRHQVGTSSRPEIFPTILAGLVLNEIIIVIGIIFVIIIVNTILFRRFICVIFNRWWWWWACGNRCRRNGRLCPAAHLLRRRRRRRAACPLGFILLKNSGNTFVSVFFLR